MSEFSLKTYPIAKSQYSDIQAFIYNKNHTFL